VVIAKLATVLTLRLVLMALEPVPSKREMQERECRIENMMDPVSNRAGIDNKNQKLTTQQREPLNDRAKREDLCQWAI
jgi:hypothetical protein